MFINVGVLYISGLLATATATLGAQAQTAAEGQWLVELAASATKC